MSYYDLDPGMRQSRKPSLFFRAVDSRVGRAAVCVVATAGIAGPLAWSAVNADTGPEGIQVGEGGEPAPGHDHNDGLLATLEVDLTILDQ